MPRSANAERAHFDREQLAKELDGYQGGRHVDAQAIKAWMKNRYHSLKRTNGTRSLVPGERKERQDFNSSQLKRLLEVSLSLSFPPPPMHFPPLHLCCLCAHVCGVVVARVGLEAACAREQNNTHGRMVGSKQCSQRADKEGSPRGACQRDTGHGGAGV